MSTEQFRFRGRDEAEDWSAWLDRYHDGQDQIVFPDDDEDLEYQHRHVEKDGNGVVIEVVSHDWSRKIYADPPIPDIPVRVPLRRSMAKATPDIPGSWRGSFSTGGYVTKDSGVRAEYASGMVRDSQDGKARFDLVMPETDDTEVSLLFALFLEQAKRENRRDDAGTEAISFLMDWYEHPGRELALKTLAAIEAVEAGGGAIRYEDLLLTRWAELMGRGAVKYGDRNWEKSDGTDGALDRARGSAVRHGLQWWNGKKDEDHAAAVCFNIGAVDYYQGRSS